MDEEPKESPEKPPQRNRTRLLAALLAAGMIVAGAAAVFATRVDSSKQAPSRGKSLGEIHGNCEGVKLLPGADLPSQAQSHPPGTTFCLAAGEYRLAAPIQPRERQRFVGVSGAVLNGSRVIEKWDQSGTTWTATGQTQGPTVVPWSGSTLKFEEAKYADDVYYDDTLLKRVLRSSDVVPGTFFFDYDNDAITIGDDPSGHSIELATAEAVFSGDAPDVTIQGLVIEKSRGRGISAGPGWTVVDSEIRLNATIGYRMVEGCVSLRNHLHHNGQYGISGSGDFLVVEQTEISFNNTHRFYVATGGNWASGGTKFVHTGDPKRGPESGLVLRGNNAHHNFGDGIWLDIENILATIENNTSSNNDRRGINYEISYEGVIRNNTITGNRDVGILISSSPDVDIYGNTVTGNGAGIIVSDRPRGKGKYGPHRARNVTVHDNVESGNGVEPTPATD
jgi:parallel beta-helix repeat protein